MFTGWAQPKSVQDPERVAQGYAALTRTGGRSMRYFCALEGHRDGTLCVRQEVSSDIWGWTRDSAPNIVPT